MSSIVSNITGNSGLGFKAQSADLQTPTTSAQATDQYGNAQTGLANQANFLQALQGQNGIQNQSQVFNQLQGVANGTGPNPAQAMLNNSTAANTANQAALMAGQRGSSANTGLIARQAAQQGAANQQNAVGQGAALQAQQSLGALGQLGNVAGQQVANQAGATNAYSNSAQGEQGQILNAINAQNQAQIGNVGQQNTANATIAKAGADQQGNLLNNLGGAAGTALPQIGTAIGGLFSGGGAAGGLMAGGGGGAAGGLMAGGGDGLASAAPLLLAAAEGGVVPSGPRSKVGQHFSGMKMAEGGAVPALVSPGEKYLNPQAVQQVKAGANPMQVGETIPGKPQVGGAKNSYANDTVPKTLQSGGVVIPRAVTQSSDKDKKAAAFVHAVLMKKSPKKK